VHRLRFLIFMTAVSCGLAGCRPSPRPCAPGTVDRDGSSANGCECVVSPEVCDLDDNDCDGLVDEGVQSLFYQDQDSDGLGGSLLVQACSAPAGFVSMSGDCQDFNAAVLPGASETCNQLDDNCDGQVDEGVATQNLYWDNDGDGFAAADAFVQQSCRASPEWVSERDVNGDGTPDWDCNDADTTTYPGAPELCGDGRDNGCSGYVDRICFSSCEGRWPFRPAYSLGTPIVRSADLNGDGLHEVIVNADFGFALLNHSGSPLLNYSAPAHNYSRSESLVADIDDYEQYGPDIQSLEVLTGNGSTPRYYKLQPTGTVTQYTTANSIGVYDASTFLASDLDRDGRVEFFTNTWCEAAGTKIFRFDRANSVINLAGTVSDPQSKCEYYSRLLTDLDGDGKAEFVFGSGYNYSTTPSAWSGHLYAYRIHPSTLAPQAYCSGDGCFSTGVTGLYGGATYSLLRFGSSIRAATYYFTSNTPNALNPGGSRFWEFGLNGLPNPGAPSQTNLLARGITDVDRDGVPENFVDAIRPGLFDVNGDGYPDRILASGRELRLGLWDAQRRDFVENSSSRVRLSNVDLSVQSIWDLDANGRLDVLASDANGNVYCQELGQDTWNKFASVPPLPIHLRTNQWDNYEPNEGTDSDGDGLPDDVVRIPSALTAKGELYGYLSTATDKDYYLIDASYGGQICVTAPRGLSYTLKIYSFKDWWNNTTHAPGSDNAKDGLVWTDTSSSQTKCFNGGLVAPPRYGEYKLVIGIESINGSFSAHWPYWISAPK